MSRTAVGYGVLCCLCLLLSSPGRANHFSWQRGRSGERECGIVISHGMELFVITTRAGGYSQARRAEIIAGRLEELAEGHRSNSRMFSVGFRNGEVILQQQEHEAHAPHIIVTIDRRLAGRSGVEQLAQWWLALLRDHLALADGRPPLHTQGTPIGVLFQKLYRALGSPSSPVSHSEVNHVVAELSPKEQGMFRRGAQVVPSTFSADAKRIAEATPSHGKTAVPHSEESAAGRERHSAEERQDALPVSDASAEDQERTAQESPPPVQGASVAKRYRVRLTVDPARPVAGQEIICILRIYEVAQGATKAETRIPLQGAKVRGWFTLEEKDYSEVPFDVARENEREGVYLWHRAFPKPGAYRLTVRFDAKGDRHFTASFPITINASQAKESSETPHGP